MHNSYLLTDKIEFNSKTEAVPYNYRISYKISQILLITDICCRQGCSFVKLNMISVAMYTNEGKTKLLDFSNDKLGIIPEIKFDPVINRAIILAISDNLIVQQKNGKFKLSSKGKSLVDLIKNDDGLMVNEKYFLYKLSNKITEEKIKNIISLWRYKYVES